MECVSDRIGIIEITKAASGTTVINALAEVITERWRYCLVKDGGVEQGSRGYDKLLDAVVLRAPAATLRRFLTVNTDSLYIVLSMMLTSCIISARFECKAGFRRSVFCSSHD